MLPEGTACELGIQRGSAFFRLPEDKKAGDRLVQPVDDSQVGLLSLADQMGLQQALQVRRARPAALDGQAVGLAQTRMSPSS